MANSSAILDKWREFFRSADSDIFSIIEFAIMVAASDCPCDLKLNRDRIAKMLFTCKLTKCFGCDKIELALPNGNSSEKSDDKCKSEIENGGSKDSKESKMNRSVDDNSPEIMEMNANQISNCCYDDAEALTSEIEEESMLFEDILRIKEVLDNNEEESNVVLFDSLRRLQLTPFSVEILKATEIGKTVNSLRKHRSKEIRNLVRTLISDWTSMVDAWVNATAAMTETATESVKTSADEVEEGLPSPPLDEGAFFATPTSMELSQFFDGLDDDENPKNSGEFNKNRESNRPRIERHKVPISNTRKTQENSSMKPQELREPCRIRSTAPPKANAPQRRPMQSRQPKINNEDSVKMKLEAAKRKLQERYQEAEKAKKQRTIQVMELHELPKQSLSQKNQNLKPGKHNRHRANGRL